MHEVLHGNDDVVALAETRVREGELAAGKHAVTFKATQKKIQAGDEPDKAQVTVMVDGQKLDPDKFDLEYDKNAKGAV